jgi:hypothetical protein
MLRMISSVFAVLFSLPAVLAQTPQPTCKNCPATYIEKQEVESYVRRAIPVSRLNPESDFRCSCIFINNSRSATA